MTATCPHLDSIDADRVAAIDRGMRGLPRHRRGLGASAHVPDLRPDRLLRQLPEPAREQARRRQRASDRSFRRARRGLELVLHRRGRLRREGRAADVHLDLRARPHRGGVPRPAHDGHLGPRACSRTSTGGCELDWDQLPRRDLRGRDRRHGDLDRRARARRAPAQRRLPRRREPSEDQLQRPLHRAHRGQRVQGRGRADDPRRHPDGPARHRLHRRVEDALVGGRREQGRDAADRLRGDRAGSTGTTSASPGRTSSPAGVWSSATRSNWPSTSKRSSSTTSSARARSSTTGRRKQLEDSPPEMTEFSPLDIPSAARAPLCRRLGRRAATKTVGWRQLESAHLASGKVAYFQALFEWARLGSNQRPLACEASALPLSYAPGRARDCRAGFRARTGGPAAD